MNNRKTLLSIVITNALAAPLAAQTNELEIYGTLAAAVENLDNSTTKTTEVSSNHSVFGIKGSTEIDESLKGVFLLDVFLGSDSGDSGNGSLYGEGRDGYVGLEGGFGTVALGYHGRPWKTSTNDMDIFGSTIADYSALMGTIPGADGVYFDAGVANAILWFLPNFKGFSGHLQYGADEQDNQSNDTGIQLNYSTKDLYLVASHDIDGRTGGNDVKATKLAGEYRFGSTKIGAILDTISDSPANTRDAYWIAASHQIGKETLKIAYAQASDSDAGNDGATYYALGLDHSFNNKLKAYIIYSKISNENGGNYGFISSPHTSTNGNTAVVTGADSDVLALGIKMDFSFKK
jgi:predicted porin